MKLNSDYVLKHILDADILVNIKDDFNGVIKLNKTSKEIIDGIINNMSINEIINTLHNKYDVDISKLEVDVDIFIKEMIQKGIIDE